MIIVFTGPGIGLHGEPITRAELKAEAEAKGHTVKACLTLDTELLVASRTDTVKARRAAERGILVIDYKAFVAECLDGRVPRTGAQPDLFIDSPTPGKSWAGHQPDLL